ncbi:hypothetical protein OAN44_00305 [Flavobacteriales bacterium]|nr:hypothetical protein [Flavobacteriales bacterium]
MKKSNFKYWQGYLGISVFVIFNTISMLFYPGGTYLDSSTEGYHFFYNFLSNLGEWTARNGEINTFSASLFNSSLAIFALSYFSFFISFLKLELKYINSKWLVYLLIASISISIISFIFISIFSAEETSKFWHLVFVKMAFRTLFIHSVLQTFIVIKIPKFDPFISLATLGFTILLFLFLLVMDFGPSAQGSQEGLFIQVTAQKTIVTGIMIYFFFQIRTALRLSKE